MLVAQKTAPGLERRKQLFCRFFCWSIVSMWHTTILQPTWSSRIPNSFDGSCLTNGSVACFWRSGVVISAISPKLRPLWSRKTTKHIDALIAQPIIIIINLIPLHYTRQPLLRPNNKIVSKNHSFLTFIWVTLSLWNSDDNHRFQEMTCGSGTFVSEFSFCQDFHTHRNETESNTMRNTCIPSLLKMVVKGDCSKNQTKQQINKTPFSKKAQQSVHFLCSFRSWEFNRLILVLL